MSANLGPSRAQVFTQWDPDGPGPRPNTLVAGGLFVDAGGVPVDNIGVWDGTAWQPLGQGVGTPQFTLNNYVSAVTTWDPDGEGPSPSAVVFGGTFTAVRSTPMKYIAMFSQGQLTQIGPGMNSFVMETVTWDPDGPGGSPRQLIAGGWFDHAGTTEVNAIARWDGVEWLPLGSGLDNFCYTMVPWDPDGDGPARELLVAGGNFQHAGGIAASRVAAWDGTEWRAMGAGFPTEVNALTTWDADGNGPEPARVVATSPLTGVAAWDGASWTPLQASNPLLRAIALTSWDPDGDGPSVPQLFAGGDNISTGGGAARWNGSAWVRAPRLGIDTAVHGFGAWDSDGEGPRTPWMILGGTFGAVADNSIRGASRIVGWDGTDWRSFGPGPDSRISTAVGWDPDGEGPEGEKLIVGGRFASVVSEDAISIASWNGDRWSPLGAGIGPRLAADIHSLVIWDHDGDGPGGTSVVVGGAFTTAGGLAAPNIARWDGTSWSVLGAGTSSAVRGLTTWDPDGPGTEGVQVVAVGAFTTAGGQPAAYAARWDGSAWHALGSGLDGIATGVTTWDPDGAGPLERIVVVTGQFSAAGGVSARRIARWDGDTWKSMGTGTVAPAPNISSVTAWDPDGDGPAAEHVVVGGSFGEIGGITANGVAKGDGSRWSPIGPGILAPVHAVGTWDPDGPGPLGKFLVAGSTLGPGIFRWDGSAWRPLGTSSPGDTSCLATWTPDPAAPEAVELVTTSVNAITGTTSVFARYTWTGVPWVAAHPQDSSVRAEDGVILHARVAPGYDFGGAVQYQWFRDGQAISDGEGGASDGGGFVSGAAGTVWGLGSNLTTWLSLTGARPSDAGEYTVVFSNSCGSAPSRAAAVTIGCAADFDGNGQVDFFDYLDFGAAFAADDPSADFNHDSQIDFFDYLDFVMAFGEC
jgi:hypothetical protein